jgi:hypothetical protein
MLEQEKPYVKLSETEYEIKIKGKTKLIEVPFGKVEKVFHAFISNGGIIDPETGQVQTDILSLISSFKDVGNILLTTFDENGQVTEPGNCSTLGTAEVIGLFQMATEVVETFIKGLTAMQTAQNQKQEALKEKDEKKKTKAP